MVVIFDPKTELNWSFQEFSGPDARDFLHRMTTVNLHRLSAGEGALGFFLTAAGKIRAQFFLGCLEEDRFVLEYDSGREGQWASALAQAIEQFTFAERQTLHAPRTESCLWVVLDPGQELPRREALTGCTILNRGSLDFGAPWFSLWGEPEKLSTWRAQALPEARVVSWADLNQRRISQVRPWVDHEISSDVMPLELGLYDGVAENKGCYPGQEVVERVITQGAPPRRLVLVAAAGDSISSAASLPEVSASSWSGSQGLVLVRKNLATLGGKLSISGHGEATVVKCAPDAPFQPL